MLRFIFAVIAHCADANEGNFCDVHSLVRARSDHTDNIRLTRYIFAYYLASVSEFLTIELISATLAEPQRLMISPQQQIFFK